jgi:hypothetical protein
MTWDDGLLELKDGADNVDGNEGVPNLAEEWQSKDLHIWVVRAEDVVYAPVNCEFGSRRVKGEVKHTNLTGGTPAYVAGEVLLAGPSQLVVNGWSGRYPVRSQEAMIGVAVAFKNSGYDVWSTGWDADARKGVPFGTIPPRRVA